jgi:hypothetical protein
MSKPVHESADALSSTNDLRHSPVPDADNPSLVLTVEGEKVFSSDGSWLHPLFELERFLQVSGTDPADCHLYDKLIGKAAALLIVRLGIRRLTTGLLSSRGERVLIANDIQYEARERVDRLLCRTEELLREVDNPDTAYAIVLARIEANR